MTVLCGVVHNTERRLQPWRKSVVKLNVLTLSMNQNPIALQMCMVFICRLKK